MVKAIDTTPGKFYKTDSVYGEYFLRDLKGKTYNMNSNVKFYRLDLLEDPPEFQMHSIHSDYEMFEIDNNDMEIIIKSIFGDEY